MLPNVPVFTKLGMSVAALRSNIAHFDFFEQ
jgi:hypothetical protein